MPMCAPGAMLNRDDRSIAVREITTAGLEAGILDKIRLPRVRR